MHRGGVRRGSAATIVVGVVLAFTHLATAIGNRGGVSAAGSGTLCSVIPFVGVRSQAGTYFVGIASADTVHAGSGGLVLSRDGGHFGAGTPRDVYGQAVRVDSLGGANDTLLQRAFERRGDRLVVVVPWDYDPGCQPTYWSRSARWIEPELEGFYTVRLRPDSTWAEGRPTFDAFAAGLQPYPHGSFFRAGYRGTDALRSRPSLDAREMFSLHRVLPLESRTARTGSTHLDPLKRWAMEHPALATKYPADAILQRHLQPDRAP